MESETVKSRTVPKVLEAPSYGSINGNDESRPTEKPKKGLSLWLASTFIVAEMAGSGVLALPRAVADAGWGGIGLIIFCGGISLYSGICLGRSWLMVEERFEEFKEKNRYPYPCIAEKAYGMKMRYFVSFCVDINLFGVSVVFLLLSSQLIGSLAASWGISFCYWILIFAAVLCPLMWLGTPDDFWPAAVIALATTFTACVILIVLIAEEVVTAENVKHTPPSLKSFCLSYGTMLFAFGGAASFPTFQNDMRDRSLFPKAATFGFLALLALYMPVAVLGYYVYGDALVANVMESLPYSVAKTVISIMLAIHVFFAFLLVINAPVQDLEEFLKIPKTFGWKRVTLRTAIMIAAAFIALSVPRFGKVLNLVGGSFTTLTSVILPCLFYLKLSAQQDPAWPDRSISLVEKVCLAVIIGCGTIGGCISTYSSITDIIEPDTFKPPCYVNISEASKF